MEHLIRRCGLAIDSDQIAICFERTYVSLEHLLNSCVFGSFDVVGVAASVIADEQYLHVWSFWV